MSHSIKWGRIVASVCGFLIVLVVTFLAITHKCYKGSRLIELGSPFIFAACSGFLLYRVENKKRSLIILASFILGAIIFSKVYLFVVHGNVIE
jgi:hypothetical protein